VRSEVLEQEDAREVDSVRRDVGVAGVRGHLVDEHIERFACVPPDQLMCRGGIDELDVVKSRQLIDQRGDVVERIDAIRRRCRTQPRDPHAN
jgi:hypothetical protein